MLWLSQGIAAAAVVAAHDDVREQLVPLALDLLRDPEEDIRVAVLRQLPELGRCWFYVCCPVTGLPSAAVELSNTPAGGAVKATGCGPEQQQVLEGLLEAVYPLLLADDDEVGS
jgi:hypothetical protein